MVGRIPLRREFKPTRKNNLDTTTVSRHEAPQQNNPKSTDYFDALPK
jgi:hypothetical protein